MRDAHVVHFGSVGARTYDLNGGRQLGHRVESDEGRNA